MISDEELLDRSLEGDRDAFESVAARYRERIFRYLITMVGDEAQTEDLVQETFRRAWTKLADFERRSKFLWWLYRIAVNLTRNFFRDRANRARLDDKVRQERGPDLVRRKSVLSSVVRHELAGMISLAVDRLPETLREAFALHHVEGLDYNAVAEIAGIPVTHVRVRVRRAATMLRDQLGDEVDSFWTEPRET